MTMLNAQNKPALPEKNTGVVKKTAAVSQKTILPVSKEKLVEITTDYGTMIARLYDSTPQHRDNFVRLVKQGFYDSLLFHRVIHEFMIQGGDPASKYASDTTLLGEGEIKGVDHIPAEFRPELFHKKGALAAARDNNPAKASSNCQFYIVEGKKYDSARLNQLDQRHQTDNKNFHYSREQKEIYERIGGTPFLDQNYTVFGEVISGLDIIDKIAAVPVKTGDRPVKDIRMKIRLLN
jgi:peptidyl-prolyl cis-trans isomerase B (cyclophilin B)